MEGPLSDHHIVALSGLNRHNPTRRDSHLGRLPSPLADQRRPSRPALEVHQFAQAQRADDPARGTGELQPAGRTERRSERDHGERLFLLA